MALQLRRACRGSQKLERQTLTLYVSEVGPLHRHYGCVVWCSCRSPNSGGEGSLCLFCLGSDPFPSTALPCPAMM